MDVLYIRSPKLGESFDAARAAIIDNFNNACGVQIQEKTLANFSTWYVEKAKQQNVREFDLSIVECSLDSLAQELRNYRGRNGAFLRDPEIWPEIVRKGAMGAVRHASLCHRIVVFVHDDGAITPELRKELHLDGAVAVKRHTELADQEAIQWISYRIDAGQSALPALTNWLPAGRQEPPIHIPRFASALLAENFAGDDPMQSWYLHVWILAVCTYSFQRRYDAIRTLCLLCTYAQRTVEDQLEGTPLLFQAAIVSDTWWNQNRDDPSIIMNFASQNITISLKQASLLDQLLHLSNGRSTLFVISENGELRGLLDVCVEEPRTRVRLDVLRNKIDGFIVSSDLAGQLWMHASDKFDEPLIFFKGEWRRELSSGNPWTALEGGLGGKWSESQLNRLHQLIGRLSDGRVGGFFIFHVDPASLAAQLGAMPLREDLAQQFRLPIDVESVSEPTMTQILGLDGAQFFDFNGRLCLACQHVSLARGADEPRVGGTKHATAWRVATRFPDAFVVAISHDGPITAFVNGTKYKTLRSPTAY